MENSSFDLIPDLFSVPFFVFIIIHQHVFNLKQEICIQFSYSHRGFLLIRVSVVLIPSSCFSWSFELFLYAVM